MISVYSSSEKNGGKNHMICPFCHQGVLMTNRVEWQKVLGGNNYYVFCENCLNLFSNGKNNGMFSLSDLSPENFNLEGLEVHDEISKISSLVFLLGGINNLRLDFKTVEELWEEYI